MAAKLLKLAGWVLLALLVVAAPFVVLSALWWSSAIHVAALAALAAVISFTSSSRVAATVIAMIFAVAATTAVALSGTTVAAAVFIAGCAGACAYSSRWGYASASMMIAILVPYYLHGPPGALPNADVGPAYYAAIAIVAAVAGLWAIAVLSYAFRKRAAKPIPLTIVPAPDAALGAVLIASACGAVAFVSLTWFPTTMWVWLLLTILLLTKPTQGLNLTQTRDRAIGTLGGTAVAAVIVAIGTPSTVAGLLAILLIVAALTAMLSGLPYWLYATFLTPAVVLMDASATDGVELAAERLGLTLLGAVIAVGLAFVVNLVVHARRRRSSGSEIAAEHQTQRTA